MKFKGQDELKHTKIEIIPMIDTMFFLLVFFVLTSIGLVQVNASGVDLPEAKSGETRTTPAELTLGIGRSGEVSVDKAQVVGGGDIGAALLAKLGQRGNGETADKVTVVINADGDVEHDVVVRAMDSARKSGFISFDIATRPYVPQESGQ